MGDEPRVMKPTSSEQAVFTEALLRNTPEARLSYLDVACADDPALRRRVEALLRAAEDAGDFLEEPPAGLSGETDSSLLAGAPGEKPGGRIGRYQLLQQIGEGGCGAVYMAEQMEPVRRRVALKVIKLGMDTKSVIARFEAERQALAMMDHPNIAKVLDAGTTETGRPYFVLELVRGIKITDFCEEHALPTEARLKLFVQVCRAIQHAHQKGIIHRDIKPSNVLVTVTEPGAPGCPRVIDFGIAKATAGERLTDKTLFTAFEQFIGTPAYMSPEQAMMTSLDIDTRTDIYALGVLLYELLTGTTPFDAKQLMSSGLDAMRRTICLEEPPKPSTRLTRELASKSGWNRGSSPRLLQVKELIPLLRGDLDWIVMKALEKDRARRYETANGLAMDVERYLSNEPVIARPPSAIYRLQKLARRNRGALLAMAMVLVALFTAIFALATSNARIRRERNEKDHALRERSTALEEARASELQAREQLRASLLHQAEASRRSGHIGQRIESLATLERAARIRPDAEQRDEAIAAMAMPDIERGALWEGWDTNRQGIAFDPAYRHYALVHNDGSLSIRALPDHRELRHLATGISSPDRGGRFAVFDLQPRWASAGAGHGARTPRHLAME